MSLMSFLKKSAWLACAVVLSQLVFNVTMLAVVSGNLQGAVLPSAVVTLMSCIIGMALCWRCSKRSVFIMGAVIALYMPAVRAFYWVVAFIQDVARGDGLPGASLTILLEQSLLISLMLAFVYIGVWAMVGGFFVRNAMMRRRHKA